MRVVSWNCRRATRTSAAWPYLLDLDPDVALLQEVSSWPREVTERYAVRDVPASKLAGEPQKFRTAVLVRGEIGKDLRLEADRPWASRELGYHAGNFLALEIHPAGSPPLNVISVYSPAWPVPRERLLDEHVEGIKLTLNPDVWAADLLWHALSRIAPAPDEPWIVAGDFNLSETFDSWRGGPRGNREWLDRMTALGLRELLREAQGALTPTFRNPANGQVLHQMDHVFVTGVLAE